MEKAYTALSRAYDALMYDVDYAAWGDYIVSLLREKGVGKGAVILDAACGTGTLSLALYRAGYNVTASDASEDMLNAAVIKFREAGADIPVILQDMRRLSLHRPCDAVVCACDGVNYLIKKQDLSAFFLSANNNLKDNGVLLFDLSTEYKLSRVLANNVFCDETEDMAYIWKNEYKARKSHMELSLFLREGEAFRRYTESHVQAAHKIEDLDALLREAGFTGVEAYAFLTRDAVSAKTERAQFAAIKKPTGKAR